MNLATPEHGAKVIYGKVECGSLETNMLSGMTGSQSMKYTFHDKNEKRNGITIDLGEHSYFNNIHILPYWHPDAKYEYQVDVSPDKLKWKTVANVVNTGTQENPWHEHKFKTVIGKYIKISGSCVANSKYFRKCLTLVSIKAYLKG